MARVCQVSPATVANWIDQGLLKGHKTPTGRRRVDADDLTAFLRTHEMAVPSELDTGSGPAMVVVVDDDPGYLKALVLTIERSDLDVEVVEAAARAASQCLDELLPDNSVALEGATIIEAFDRKFVLVAVHGLGGREAQLLTGTCEIRESTERAAVLAVLDATNRWTDARR